MPGLTFSDRCPPKRSTDDVVVPMGHLAFGFGNTQPAELRHCLAPHFGCQPVAPRTDGKQCAHGDR